MPYRFHPRDRFTSTYGPGQRLTFPGQQVTHQIGVLPTGHVQAEVAGSLPGCGTQSLGELAVCEQSLNGPCHRPGIASRDEQAILFVFDQFNTSTNGRGDDWQSGGHVLQQGV